MFSRRARAGTIAAVRPKDQASWQPHQNKKRIALLSNPFYRLHSMRLHNAERWSKKSYPTVSVGRLFHQSKPAF
jgi:hypothetical protein